MGAGSARSAGKSDRAASVKIAMLTRRAAYENRLAISHAVLQKLRCQAYAQRYVFPTAVPLVTAAFPADAHFIAGPSPIVGKPSAAEAASVRR
jgi:hypothetical protein